MCGCANLSFCRVSLQWIGPDGSKRLVGIARKIGLFKFTCLILFKDLEHLSMNYFLSAAAVNTSKRSLITWRQVADAVVSHPLCVRSSWQWFVRAHARPQQHVGTRQVGSHWVFLVQVLITYSKIKAMQISYYSARTVLIDFSSVWFLVFLHFKGIQFLLRGVLSYHGDRR